MRAGQPRTSHPPAKLRILIDKTSGSAGPCLFCCVLVVFKCMPAGASPVELGVEPVRKPLPAATFPETKWNWLNPWIANYWESQISTTWSKARSSRDFERTTIETSGLLLGGSKSVEATTCVIRPRSFGNLETQRHRANVFTSSLLTQ